MNKHRGDGRDDEGNRRVAVLWVGEEDVFQASVTWLTASEPPGCRLKLRYDGVPIDDDISVVRVTHDPLRRAFGFLLHHESFAPVPEGCPAPDLSWTAKVWTWEPVSPTVFHYPTPNLSAGQLGGLRNEVERYTSGTVTRLTDGATWVQGTNPDPAIKASIAAACRQIERDTAPQQGNGGWDDLFPDVPGYAKSVEVTAGFYTRVVYDELPHEVVTVTCDHAVGHGTGCLCVSCRTLYPTTLPKNDSGSDGNDGPHIIEVK